MEEAGTSANIVDPPATTRFKAGMDALALYASTLTVLASGANSADTSAQLKTIAANLAGIAATVGLLTGAVAPEITVAIGALAPLVDQAAAQLSRDEARRLILSGDDKVQVLIESEKAAAPAIWQIITSDWRDGLKRLHRQDVQAAKDLNGKVESYRTIISNYIIMLDRLKLAWSKTVAATRNPQPATLADLTTLSNQLKADSDTIAKTFAALRAGPAK